MDAHGIYMGQHKASQESLGALKESYGIHLESSWMLMGSTWASMGPAWNPFGSLGKNRGWPAFYKESSRLLRANDTDRWVGAGNRIAVTAPVYPVYVLSLIHI